MRFFRRIIVIFAWLPVLIAVVAIWSYVKKLTPRPLDYFISHLYVEPPPDSEMKYITRFDAERDFELWRRDGAKLTPSGAWGRIVFEAGKDTPGIRLRDSTFGPAGVKDWSDYSRLRWEMLPLEDAGKSLLVILKDAGERRYTKAFGLFGGTATSVTIDLAELVPWLDLERMAEIHFYIKKPDEEVALDVKDLRLEKSGVPPGGALGRPFVVFEGLEAPERAAPGRTIEVSASLSLTKPQDFPFAVFIHLFHERDSDEEVPSRRAGFIHAERPPFVPVPDWKAGETETVGPFYIHLSRANPPGRYLVRMGLFNPRSSGRGPRDAVYDGAFDYGGTFPKCRYTDPGIRDFVVGSVVVEEGH